MLISELLDQLYLFILGIPRLAMALMFIPMMSARSLGGGIIRNAVLIGFTFFIYPIISGQLTNLDISKVSLLTIMIQEVMIGLLFGFFIGIPFFMVNAFGGIVDIQRGSQMSQIFNPGAGGSTSEMTTFFSTCFSYTFFIMGPFLISIATVMKSYSYILISLSFDQFTNDTIKGIASAFQDALESSLTFVLPIMMVIFLIDLTLGLVNRFVSAINVFILSLSIKSVAGVFMSLILLSMVMDNFYDFTMINLHGLKDLKQYFK